MDFASPHVYVKDDIDRVGRQASDEESVGSNDLEDDLEDFVARISLSLFFFLCLVKIAESQEPSPK